MALEEERSLADKLFPPETDDFADSILSIPPELRRLHTETYDFSVTTIKGYLESQHMFVPSFQRGYVWTEPQASRLIESLIIQCPIPVIYLSQEPDERFSVIDGNQRLTSIKNFLDNQFVLKGLTAYPELEGLHFFELDPRFQRHILNRTLRCIVILKDTHPQVKFDVFERLNTGAVKLSAQELRHGLYHGKFVRWIDKKAKARSWRELLRLKNDKRMKAEEYILRFLAFRFSYDSYEKPLAAFLNTFSEKHRNASDAQLGEFEEALEHATKGVQAIFGDLAFKIFDSQSNNKILSQFNAALFDAQMLAISRTGFNADTVTEEMRQQVLAETAELLYDDQFQKSITLATSDVAQIRTRVAMMQALIASHQ